MICRELLKKTKRLKNIFTHATVKPGTVDIYCVTLIFLKTDIFSALSVSMEKTISIIINRDFFSFSSIKEKTYI